MTRGRKKGQNVETRPREQIREEKQKKLRIRSNRFVKQSKNVLLGRDAEMRELAQEDITVVINALVRLLEQSRTKEKDVELFE